MGAKMGANCNIKNIRIMLDEEKHDYQSGESVTGVVVVTVKGDVVLSELSIKLFCDIEVGWSEVPGFRRESGHNIIKERCLDLDSYIPDQYCNKNMKDGINEIPFSFQLPESGIPSSFVATYGSINYMIKAFVSASDLDESASTEEGIQVEAPIKRNLLLAVTGQTEKQLSFYNLGSGTIWLKANIRKKGYQPGKLTKNSSKEASYKFDQGETVQVVCTVLNDSTADVRPRASLRQTQIYMSGHRHKTIESIVLENVIGEKVENDSNNWSLISLPIPEDLPLSLKCPNISIKYFIIVSLHIPCAIDLLLNLPIIITNRHAFKYCD